MKRLLFLAALFTCSLFTYAQLLGSGTEDDPYMIYDADDLNEVRNYVGVQGIYFQLANDIDLSAYNEGEGWEPIGTIGTNFKGIFNGNGFTIRNLKIKRPDSNYVGLFGYCSNSKITNLSIICDITGNSDVGALCGYASASQFDNCQSSSTIKGAGDTGGLIGLMEDNNYTVINCQVGGKIICSSDNCGGIIGRSLTSVSFTNCLFDGQIESTAGYVGGCIGKTDESSSISDCIVNSPKIKGVSNVGGFCGYSTKLNVNNCNATVFIEGDKYVGGVLGSTNEHYSEGIISFCNINATINANSYVGGIAGHYSGNINICKIEGTISANSQYVGGVAGFLSRSYSPSCIISNCVFSGSIVSQSGNVGGVVGGMNTYCQVMDCVSYATIEGDNCVGGISGYLNSYNYTEFHNMLNRCLALNTEIKSSQSSIGRVVGKGGNSGNTSTNLALNTTKVYINNSLTTVSDGTLNGTSYGSAILKMKSTYTDLGWDFDEIWDIDEGSSYPYLRYFNPTEEQSIAFEAPSLTYGDEYYALPSQTEQGLTINWSSSDEDVAVVSGNTLTIHGAGSCFLVAEQAGDNIYKPIRETYPITIAKAPLKITADNYTRNIGEDNPELSVSYTGFVNDEDETVLSTLPSISTDATTSSPVGVYTITVAGAEADNYEITYVNGTLTVIDGVALRNTLTTEMGIFRTGKTSTLSISLDNEDELIAFEFFMTLPEGISIAEDEDGYPDAVLSSGRSNRHSLEVDQRADGSYHFLCYSNSNNALKGNSGELLSITLCCEEGVEPDTYQGTLYTINFSDINENRIVLPNLNFSIEVTDVTMGDVNDDGFIDVMDIVAMVNKIMEHPSASFVFAAADHDGSGLIDVMDLVKEVRLVMNQTANAPSGSFDGLSGALSLQPSTDGTVSLSISDASRYVASQFVVTLSPGQHLADVSTDSRHTVSFERIADNQYAVVSYSPGNDTYTSNAAALTLHVEGAGEVSVDNAVFASEGMEKVLFQGVGSGYTDGIRGLTYDFSVPADIYSPSGILLRKDATSADGLKPGVYIVNGHKYIKK